MSASDVLPGYATAATTASKRIAVSLVIDTSGSMEETDPANLRKTAADIFVDMLSPEDYVGIVSFSTEVTELAPMQQVGDATNKQAIKGALGPNCQCEREHELSVGLAKGRTAIGQLYAR